MTELHWPDIRRATTERFNGQTPRAEDEARIIDHFETSPTMVLAAIDAVADAVHTGIVNWGWSALAARLDKQAEALANTTVNTQTAPDREKRIRNAERWIRTTGLHYDRPSEIEHELFGDARIHPTIDERTGEMIVSSTPGPLAPWANDLDLRKRLLDVWQHERPRGQACEADELARADRYRQQRANLTHPPTQAPSTPPQTTPQPEPDVFATQGAAT